jgi:hypothetical protein
MGACSIPTPPNTLIWSTSGNAEKCVLQGLPEEGRPNPRGTGAPSAGRRGASLPWMRPLWSWYFNSEPRVSLLIPDHRVSHTARQSGSPRIMNERRGTSR